jgi:hypothetical protein
MLASQVDILRSWSFQKETAGCRVRVSDYNIRKFFVTRRNFDSKKAIAGQLLLLWRREPIGLDPLYGFRRTCFFPIG